MRIAVTGAGGFIGSALLPFLEANAIEAVTVPRGVGTVPPNCRALIHLAGIAHRSASPEEFAAANITLAVETAAAARASGVGRFVFVSSIAAVAGHRGIVLTPDLPARPTTAYGAAKAEAERALLAVDGIEIAVIRPPAVLGARPKGNLARLMRLCASGLPLPFGSVRNRRSMIGVTNLADALLFLARADAPRVSGRIFHVAEAAPYGLAELVAECRTAMGRRPGLFPFPPSLLSLGLRAAGRGAMADQLLGDLLVDDSQLRNAGWQGRDTAFSDVCAMAQSFG